MVFCILVLFNCRRDICLCLVMTAAPRAVIDSIPLDVILPLHRTQYKALLHCTQYWAVLHCTQYWAVLHCTQYSAVPHCTHYWAVLHCTQYWAVLHCTH